jgi:hypothetical protein
MSRAALSAIALGAAGAVGLIVLWLDGFRHDCEARWGASGFSFEYRDGACMVLAGSRWVPETAVRVWVRR